MRVWVPIVVVIVLLAAGFAYLQTRQQNQYESVQQVVDDLAQQGVECRDLTVSQAPETEAAGAEFGFCYITEQRKNTHPESVTIHVYEDAGLIDQHIQRHLASRGNTKNNFTVLVTDSNWIVEGYSKDILERVHGALGGEIQ